MVPVPLSRLQPSRTDEIEDWPYLDEAVRCQGWSEDLHRQRGWAPEVA